MSFIGPPNDGFRGTAANPTVTAGGSPPAPPVLEASGTIASATTNLLTVSLPSGVEEGDLLLLLGFNDIENSSFPMSVSTPAGYTKILEAGDTVSDARVAGWWKVAGASETTDPIIGLGGSARMLGRCYRISGADPTTPILDSSSAVMPASTSHDIPGITTTVDNTLVFSAFSFDGVFSANLTFVGGNDWNNAGYLRALPLSAAQGAQGQVAQKQMLTAGATGTWNVTSRNDTGVHANFVIQSPT